MYECAAHEAKYLRMEMEDLGTTGDGDNKPEVIQKQWEVSLCTRIEIRLKVTSLYVKEEVQVCAGGGGGERRRKCALFCCCACFFMFMAYFICV